MHPLFLFSKTRAALFFFVDVYKRQRPYQADEESNHGIDKLICSYGAAVITEDSISHLVEKFPTSILNP